MCWKTSTRRKSLPAHMDAFNGPTLFEGGLHFSLVTIFGGDTWGSFAVKKKKCRLKDGLTHWLTTFVWLRKTILTRILPMVPTRATSLVLNSFLTSCFLYHLYEFFRNTFFLVKKKVTRKYNWLQICSTKNRLRVDILSTSVFLWCPSRIRC